MPHAASPIGSTITSPNDFSSRTASPSQTASSVHTQEVNEHLQWPADSNGLHNTPTSPEAAQDQETAALTSPLSIPDSPKASSKHGRDHSRSLFANLKASKSSNKVHKLEATIRQVSEDVSRDRTKTDGPTLYSLQKGPGSTPDLSLSTLNTSSLDVPGALVTTSSDSSSMRKNRPRFTHLLTRTRSIRSDDAGGRRLKPPTPIQTTVQEGPNDDEDGDETGGLRTAPLDTDSSRSFRDLMGSAIRNKSADRQPNHKQSTGSFTRGRPGGQQRSLAPSASTVFRDGAGSRLFANLKGTSSKAADGLGKAGKGIFNKMGRSGSSHSKEDPADEPYQFIVINLPLVEQTRRTRIAKRMEDSRDKTEFWMPALPWRCIDYLNYRGCEEEGLYRVPGSGTKIKHYQERFDRELDINLFDESELYDINIIGSLFKAWLRDLPSEILPKATQARVAAAHPDAVEVPQMLRDELSNLPPWNYYLLFAITCHLSLLHACHEKNKMSYSNLCICFQPCIGIDAYCFQFLVCDWRSCWQGCLTEKLYLEQEYRAIESENRPESRMPEPEGIDSNIVVRINDTSQPSEGNSRSNLLGRGGRDKNPSPASQNRARPSTERSTYLSSPPGHNRSESQLPEIQPMTPMTWDVASNQPQGNRPASQTR
ncbi:MAG: hypothetical protein L6R37_007983 [Teloschistes peruensis]|nr:MAG: hypothetical protein L6R37_007983 [Teloschistes peruensis]